MLVTHYQRYKNPNRLLIEFHDRFVENGRIKTQQTIKKLNAHGYEIFAISDSFEEISFIKKNVL